MREDVEDQVKVWRKATKFIKMTKISSGKQGISSAVAQYPRKNQGITINSFKTPRRVQKLIMDQFPA